MSEPPDSSHGRIIHDVPTSCRQSEIKNQKSKITDLTAGVARLTITPFWGIELAGWGYYLNRTWQRVHDHLHATALVLHDGNRAVVIVALDLMIIGRKFTQRTRKLIYRETGIAPNAILLTCSHSHNAPASGGILGGGQVDPLYEEWASRQAATAAIEAWRNRKSAQLRPGSGELSGHTFNRTRENGPVDTRLTTLTVDDQKGNPLAVVVNFQAHPTVATKLRPFDVSRDVPGQVCDLIEASLSGAIALYLQGACGDVNFHRHYATPQRCHEPARALADLALTCHRQAKSMVRNTVAAATKIVALPTRRWKKAEIDFDRTEGLRRLKTNDTTDWRETLGRVMTQRPEEMVDRHGGDLTKAVRAMARFNVEWTDRLLKDWQTRALALHSEVQALRVGDLFLVANSAELFSTFALNVRQQSQVEHLMIAGYANGRIGYVPDDYNIANQTYAAYQSPKYCNQFPFTAKSGPQLSAGMVDVINKCGNDS